MRLKAIQAKAFGRLEKWESSSITEGLVVIYGPNEAGKSTLFHLIKTLLYGWHPANKEEHPYTPWQGANPHIEGLIEEKEGSVFSVVRQLTSRPSGVMITENRTQNLGNLPLPQVNFLPREIYEHIYALTVDELSLPTPKVWAHLEDQLFGGQFAPFIRPVRTVIEELKNEANSLWRTDRRGQPQAKEIADKLRILYQRRKAAAENDKNLYRLQAERDQYLQQLRASTEEKIRANTGLERLQRLYPVQKRIAQIALLKEKAGDLEKYSGIPANIQDVLPELENKIREKQTRLDKIGEREEQLSENPPVLSKEEYALLDYEKEIVRLSNSYHLIEAELKKLDEVRKEGEFSVLRLHELSRDLFTGGWNRQYIPAIKEINEANLGAELKGYKQAFNRYQETLAQYQGLQARLEKGVGFVLKIIAVFFLGGIGIYRLIFNDLLEGLIFLLVGVGVGYSLNLYSYPELKKMKATMEKLAEEIKQEKDVIIQELRELPFSLKRIESPDESLLIDLQRLRDILTELEKVELREKNILEHIKDKEKILNEVCNRCNFSQDNFLSDIEMLEKALLKAQEKNNLVKKSEQEKEVLQKEREILENELRASVKEHLSYVSILEEIGGESVQENIRIFLERRKQWETSQALEEDLYREYPHLEELQKEIEYLEEEGENWLDYDQKIARAKEKSAEIEQKIVEINRQLGKLNSDLINGEKEERLDELCGEIAHLEDKRDYVLKKRDRLILLSNILKEADFRFREKHQPDVLQKAGKYLETITAGKYNRISLEEERKSLYVHSQKDGEFIEAGPSLSRGTLEQIYLALRLALVEHLEQSFNPLPLFFDEVLVNWDSFRLENGLKILTELAQKRQVFLFTCHDWLKDYLREKENVQVLDI